MRDVSTELRFVHIVISVLKDGYPLHTKTIYLVFNGPRSSKSVASFQKVTKGDICMVSGEPYETCCMFGWFFKCCAEMNLY